MSISVSVSPLDSRNNFFRSIGASRIGSSWRNREAFSIRESRGSGVSGSAASVLSDCSGILGGCCRCHEGICLDLGPSESLIAWIAVVAAVQEKALNGRLNLGSAY